MLTWALSKLGFPLIPDERLHVALFLTDQTETATENCLGFSSLEGAVYSVAYVHKLASFHISPTDHPFVKSTLEDTRRSLAKPVRPKVPLATFRSEYKCEYAFFVLSTRTW